MSIQRGAAGEVATALSLRASLGPTPGGRAVSRARIWLLRIAAGSLVIAGLAWAATALLPGIRHGPLAVAVYASLTVAVVTAVGWASLVATDRPAPSQRGRGA